MVGALHTANNSGLGAAGGLPPLAFGKFDYKLHQTAHVGAMTGKGALPHDQSWVDSVFEKSYCKNIHLKQNVKKEVDCGTKNIAVG